MLCCTKLKNFCNNMRYGLEHCLSPALLLVIRLFMASIFFQSGWLKFKNYLDGNWDLTLYLFEQEHPVRLRSDIAQSWGVMPFEFLPPNIAAVLGTGGELIFSTLLAVGLFGRFAALGLLFMTAVIQFTYKDLEVHYYWALLLSVILFYGAGKLSLDRVLCGAKCSVKKCEKSS